MMTGTPTLVMKVERSEVIQYRSQPNQLWKAKCDLCYLFHQQGSYVQYKWAVCGTDCLL